MRVVLLPGAADVLRLPILLLRHVADVPLMLCLRVLLAALLLDGSRVRRGSPSGRARSRGRVPSSVFFSAPRRSRGLDALPLRPSHRPAASDSSRLRRGRPLGRARSWGRAPSILLRVRICCLCLRPPWLRSLFLLQRQPHLVFLLPPCLKVMLCLGLLCQRQMS